MNNIQEQARAYRENYGEPRRHEAWRWIPLDALTARERKSEGSDYQYDLPDAVGEDYGDFADADRRLLDLPDAPYLAQNLAEQRDSLLLTVPENTSLDAPLVLNIDLATPRLQHSRIHLRLGKNSRAACWIDYQAGRAGAQLPVLSIDAAEGAELDLALWFHGTEHTAQLMHIASQQAADRSMRYVLAVQPQGGQPNMSYEGMRWGDRHLRSFAFGDNTNRRWIAPRNNVWRKFDSYVNANDPVRSRLMAIFCNDGRALTAQELDQRIRSMGGLH